MLASLEDAYDLAILDCAPSISLVSENVFDAADLLLVPLVPSTLSVRTLEQLRAFLDSPARSRRPRCSRSSRWSTGASGCTASCVTSLPASVNGMSDAVVPSASVVELMGPRRSPVVLSHPRTPAAQAYASLWAEVGAALEAP